MNRTVELVGPEPLPLDELVRRFLGATDDSRPVIADTRARYFGAELNDYSLAGERDHYRDRWRISRNIGVQRRSSVLWRDIHGGGVVPCERRGMEEVKIVPESISGIQYYQIIRSQIEHEDNLINQRLSWFVAAQAFLFSAYAILLKCAVAGTSTKLRYTTRNPLFSDSPGGRRGEHSHLYNGHCGNVGNGQLKTPPENPYERKGQRLIASSSGIQTNVAARAGLANLNTIPFYD